MPKKTVEEKKEYEKKRRESPGYKEKMKKIQHEWYLKNKEAVRKQTTRWTSKNKKRWLEYRRDWERDNREKSGWKRELRIEYSITPEQYFEIFTKQDGCCAICGKSQKELDRRLAIDHCHETGKIRGLLCFGCNTSLGKWNDDPKLLQKALEYLNGR